MLKKMKIVFVLIISLLLNACASINHQNINDEFVVSESGSSCSYNGWDECQPVNNKAVVSEPSYGGGTVSVKGYYKKNGTYVKSYSRRK
jgi:major membrane immunogen (membrane-anchored lipoprotein)